MANLIEIWWHWCFWNVLALPTVKQNSINLFFIRLLQQHRKTTKKDRKASASSRSYADAKQWRTSLQITYVLKLIPIRDLFPFINLFPLLGLLDTLFHFSLQSNCIENNVSKKTRVLVWLVPTCDELSNQSEWMKNARKWSLVHSKQTKELLFLKEKPCTGVIVHAKVHITFLEGRQLF